MSAAATVLLWLNLAVLAVSFGMISTAIATAFDPDESHALRFFLHLHRDRLRHLRRRWWG